jgi:hypothetical protein
MQLMRLDTKGVLLHLGGNLYLELVNGDLVPKITGHDELSKLDSWSGTWQITDTIQVQRKNTPFGRFVNVILSGYGNVAIFYIDEGENWCLERFEE